MMLVPKHVKIVRETSWPADVAPFKQAATIRFNKPTCSNTAPNDIAQMINHIVLSMEDIPPRDNKSFRLSSDVLKITPSNNADHTTII